MALTTDSTTVVQPKVVTTTTTTSQPTGAQQVQEQTYNYQPTEDDKNMGLQIERTTTQKEKAVSATEAKSKHLELVSINLKIKKIDDKMKKINNINNNIKGEITKGNLQELGLRKTRDQLKFQYQQELLGGGAAVLGGALIAASAGAAIPLMIFGAAIFAAGLAVGGKGVSDYFASRKGGYDLHLSQEKYRDDIKEMYMQLAEERESLNAQLAELNK